MTAVSEWSTDDGWVVSLERGAGFASLRAVGPSGEFAYYDWPASGRPVEGDPTDA